MNATIRPARPRRDPQRPGAGDRRPRCRSRTGRRPDGRAARPRAPLPAPLLAGLIALAAAALGAPAAAAQDFTIRDVLSAPMPSNLVAAPEGGAVAWVHDREGVRNIWVAEPPEYRGRRLTSYQSDDGQSLSSLEFTPDGASIVYVRGGQPNRAGDFPNPTSDPEGVERATWIVPADGSASPRKLADAAGPSVSPAGDVIAYSADGEIRTVALADPDAEPETIAEVRGGAGSLTWSPDGSRLAFASRRGGHGFVGVLEPAAGEIQWLDPGLDRDGSPVWSPDGERIAFLRIPNREDQLPFMPQREARIPWSIVVADAATGRARTIWTADAGPGSAFQGVSAENALLWADDRLVFPWEKDGWLHLWSVSVPDDVPEDGAGPATRTVSAGQQRAGAQATLLTPGRFEVQHVALGADGEEVLYSSNQGDIDRKHLWRVPVDGGREPEPLTPGTGIEWAPVPTSDGDAVAFLASGARTPARAEVLVDGERRALAPGTIPDAFPADQLVVPEQVVFRSADGMEIHGQLFRPEGLEASVRRPALVFFHGGSRRQMLLGFHHRGYYHNAYALNQWFASRGYIVLSVNYRSGIGYGLDFREAENYGATGASEFNDVLGAGLYLQGRPDVDPTRIGLWGGSYGGYMTAFGLARAPDLFAAGVDLHGAHDWNVIINNFRPSYEPEQRPEFAERAYESSPIAYVDTWRSPVLMIHGDDDRNVPFSESVTLAEELRARGVEVESLVFPDEVHGFLLHENWIDAYRAAIDFFDRKLGQPRTARAGG